MLLRSVRGILESDGHAVVTAAGGQAGIDAFNAVRLRGELFVVALTDMGMPYVDGRKVARAIKQTPLRARL